jgi:hypothetical protein
VLDTAIPTAKAPTIGDSPINAALPAAPKKAAVVIPSTLPSERHYLSTCNILGTRITIPTSKTTNSPSILESKRLFRIYQVLYFLSAPLL